MAQTRRASLWKAEHGVDLAEVLDAVAGVVLVRRQVRVDEEEGGAEEEEGGRHGALRPELHARTSVERVRLRHGTVPEIDFWSYKKVTYLLSSIRSKSLTTIRLAMLEHYQMRSLRRKTAVCSEPRPHE